MSAGLAVRVQPGGGHVLLPEGGHHPRQLPGEGLSQQGGVQRVDVLTDVAQQRVQPHALLGGGGSGDYKEGEI